MDATKAVQPDPFRSAWASICAELDKQFPEWMSLAETPEQASVEAIRRLAEGAIPIKGRRPGLTTQAIVTAAEKLVRGKGRYHSEQNYRALAGLFGVTTPDLEPLKGDAITLTHEALLSAAGEVYAAGYNHGHLNTADHLPYADDGELRERGAEKIFEAIDFAEGSNEKA